MSTPRKRIFAYAKIRLLGAICNWQSANSEFTIRKVVFLGVVADVDVVTFCEIATKRENCT